MRQLGEDMNQFAMGQVFCWSARVMCLGISPLPIQASRIGFASSPRVYEKVVGKQEKRWYPHLYMKNRKQRGPLPMETNEKLKMALLQETEKELLKMIDD